MNLQGAVAGKKVSSDAELFRAKQVGRDQGVKKHLLVAS